MLQPEDVADCVVTIACLPPRATSRNWSSSRPCRRTPQHFDTFVFDVAIFFSIRRVVPCHAA